MPAESVSTTECAGGCRPQQAGSESLAAGGTARCCLCYTAICAYGQLDWEGLPGPGPPCRLTVFGFIGPNGRLDALFEACPGLREKALFGLDICGELLDRSCACRIRSLGLESWVSIHGFAPAEVLREKWRVRTWL